MEVINALGRRKTAVARVYLTKGKGVITVNNKAAKDVFPTDVLQSKPITISTLQKLGTWE